MTWANGWVVSSAQHSYVPNNAYKGIHCIVHSDRLDASFELQFHTEASIAVKDATHRTYEMARDIHAPMGDRLRADAWLRQQSSVLSDPPGVGSFTDLGGVDVRRIEYLAKRS